MVRRRYFDLHDTSDYNKGKLANNTKLSMIAYDIIDRKAVLTDFGESLYHLRNDYVTLVNALAKYILLHKFGLTLIECIRDMESASAKITLTSLRKWLDDRGIHFPRGGRHPSTMRLWLEEAKIFYDTWRINEKKLEIIIGAPLSNILELSLLSEEQRSFLRTLSNIYENKPLLSNEIEKLATATYGTKFNEKNLPKQVLYPLQDKGYITLTRGTKKRGRGAKPFYVEFTEKLERDIIEPMLIQIDKQIHVEIRPYLRKSFDELLVEMKSSNRYLKGLALEALAFKVMRLLGLEYISTRLRGSQTGGAEVDLIFESTQPVFTRWQVQCKNTRSVRLNDIAKEVGLTFSLKSNVVVIISTGKIGPEARKYSNTVMTDTNLDIVLIDSSDMEIIKENPPSIVDIMFRESKHTSHIKKLILTDE